MPGSDGVDAILERLIDQFASPYDFLRELVQNAMDAGSDIVEVVLETHAIDDDEVVFELIVRDTGDGMDETIIDSELTRLFASSKTDDRTMAGGFGIGFVSVFAWEPDVVLLQTGRVGEAWELVFHADRSFEKIPVAEPLEGTTLRLFKRGLAAEREAVAEAVRDSLWRWARFCPLEVTFEDLGGDGFPELIQDSPFEQVSGDEALMHVEEHGDTTVRVSFGVPTHAVLMRRGLVLAEGPPEVLLADVGQALGDSLRHLRVWADSPFLRTTLARDKVVEASGREAVESRIVSAVERLRAELLDRVVSAAGVASWSPARHEVYANLHAHLACERATLGDAIVDQPILRGLDGKPWSLRQLREAPWQAVCVVDLAEVGGELAMLAVRGGVPVLVARMAEDSGWLVPLLATIGRSPVELTEVSTRVEVVDDAAALTELVQQILRRSSARLGRCDVGLARFLDAPRPLVGIAADVGGLAVFGAAPGPQRLGWTRLWLNGDHAVVRAAQKLHPREPLLAATAVALAVSGQLAAHGPEPVAVADAVDAVRGA